MLALLWQSRQFVHVFLRLGASTILVATCESALEVAEIGLVGHEVFPMFLGLGTLVFGSDDVP